MIPTSIDGTDITGATIDGTDVQEITVDGQTVFTAGPPVPQPDLHYTFSETSGSTVADVTGNGNTGIVNGSTNLNVTGEIGSGVEFPGVSGSNIEPGDIIDESEGTFTFYAKVSSRPNRFIGVIDNSIDGNDWEAWYDDNAGGFNWRPGSTGISIGTLNNETVFKHFALTWKENDVAEIYINGVLQASSSTGSLDPAATTFIGQGNSGNGPSGWTVDEFKHFNRKLTSTEIQTVYNNP